MENVSPQQQQQQRIGAKVTVEEYFYDKKASTWRFYIRIHWSPWANIL